MATRLKFTDTGSLSVPTSILLADDDNLVRTLLQRILEKSGHHVTAVASGEEAAQLFSANRFDLLITDIMMPGIDGFELLAYVKRVDPNVDVIIITGAPSTQLALDALRDGRVADFIIKPFDHTALRQTVSRVLRERRVRLFNQSLTDRLNATLEKQSRQIILLSELVQVQSRISSSLHAGEVLQAATDQAQHLLNSDWALAVVLDDHSHLKIAALTGLPFQAQDLLGLTLGPEMHPAFAALGASSLARSYMLMPNEPLGIALGIDDSHALIVAPLVTTGELFGALLIGTASTTPYEENEVVVVNLLVQQLVVAIVNAQLHAEVRALATTDALTGLLNRRALWDRAERSLRRLEMQKGSMAVIMLDIDNFKVVNDTFGHTAGDLVLKNLGEICNTAVRPSDLVGRYGGEEFMVVAIDVREEEAATIAQRIWRQIGATPVSWRGEDIHITVSVGVAISVPERRLSFNRLVVAADEAQYQAKQQGKNRIVLAWTDAPIIE